MRYNYCYCHLLYAQLPHFLRTYHCSIISILCTVDCLPGLNILKNSTSHWCTRRDIIYYSRSQHGPPPFPHLTLNLTYLSIYLTSSRLSSSHLALYTILYLTSHHITSSHDTKLINSLHFTNVEYNYLLFCSLKDTVKL